MFYTGLADEAAPDLEGQIKATQALGWSHLEARSVDGVQWHELPEAEFERAAGQLRDAGIRVNCLASAIANWATAINDPFDKTLGQARRSIDRMKRLGTRQVRVMSFAVLEGRGPEDQMQDERFRRLRELQKMFAAAGLEMLHENCMNYGGMGWTYTLRLLEEVPGMQLVFDTGNPVVNLDRSKPQPWTWQDAFEFYEHVRSHVRHVQVKDGWHDDAAGKDVFTFPGEGKAQVRRVLADLLARGYDGALSIEPHMVTVFHDPKAPTHEERRRMHENYLEYGRRLMAMVESIQAGAPAPAA